MTLQPHELVWSLATAGFAARCVHVIADLGVADFVGESGASADEFAAACHVDRDALDRVMNLLAAQGLNRVVETASPMRIVEAVPR